MSKECFFGILGQVKPLLDPKPNCPNYRFLSAEKNPEITLYDQKDTGSFWIGWPQIHLVHQCIVSKTIFEVCKAINAILGPNYQHLPCSENDTRKIASEFELKFRMPQSFGCIDGTHIHTKRPIELRLL